MRLKPAQTPPTEQAPDRDCRQVFADLLHCLSDLTETLAVFVEHDRPPDRTAN